MLAPLITVIMPVYNAEEYVGSAIDSVLAQTYPNIEVIAVDDGSADRSGTVLDDYAARYPQVKVIHKNNEGVTSARLAGIKEAKGEYIAFVDCDDLIDADMYQRLMQNMRQYGADIAHCGYRRKKGDSIQFFYNTGATVLQNNTDGLRDLLTGKFIEPSLCNKLFAHQLIRRATEKYSFDDSIRNNEDLLMNYCFFSFSEKAVFEDFCPYQYLVRDGSASKGKMNEHILFDPVKVARLIYRDSQGDAAVHSAAVGLYVVKLIRAATYYESNADFDVASIRKEAQKELKDFLSEIKAERSISRKNKMFAVAAVYCPYLYQLVHKIYLKNK